MNQKIEKVIQESERLLIGIGAEFSPQVPKWEGPNCLEPFYKTCYYEQISEKEEILQAYRRLREEIGDRPYFVVTLNTDDLIYRAGFEPECVVAPCGSNGKLQCGEHIVEAGEIAKRIMREYQEEASNKDESVPNISGKDVLQRGGEKEQEQGLTEEADLEKLEEIARKIRKTEAVCPVCGKELMPHTIETDGYLERGYLSQWEAYKKWLATTLNKKLCVLELGVGFQYPQVIRFPFERTAFYNKKAVFVRVHSKFPQIEKELAGKAITVKESPVAWLLEEPGED